MRRLLVTGGCGFIGSNFIRYWVQRYPNDTVVNLDALTYAGHVENLADLGNGANYHFVHGNICDDALVTKLFEQHGIDAVVNFAAESHVDRSISNPREFIDTNVVGTLTLLNAARSAWDGDSSCRFLHVSTDEVFGSLGPEDPAFSETTPFAPNSPYSASKAASDHLVRSYFHTFDLPVVTTNCSNNYGPYQFPEKLIPLVLMNALAGKALPIYGDGKNIRDWLYVEDHCSGIDAVLQNGRLGETYNIGGCNEWANIDIVQHICAYLDQVVPGDAPKSELITYVKDRAGHDRRYAIDARKIEVELGWTPAHRFEEGIVKTVDWYLANQGWITAVTSK